MVFSFGKKKEKKKKSTFHSKKVKYSDVSKL